MGIKERKEREREQRRSIIIDAAERVFFDNGVENSSMNEVADAAELSKGTLYLYFSSKDDIFHGIIFRALTLLKEMFKEVRSKNDSGGEKLFKIGKAYMNFFYKYPNYFNAMLHQEKIDIDIGIPDNSYLSKCSKVGDEIFSIIGDTISEGIEDGTLRSDLDPIKHSLALWGQVTGVLQIVSSKGAVLKKMTGKSSGDLIEYTFEMIRRCSTNIDKNS